MERSEDFAGLGIGGGGFLSDLDACEQKASFVLTGSPGKAGRRMNPGAGIAGARGFGTRR
jgi:hypothetical protein